MPSKMKRPWTLSDVERLRDMAARGLVCSQIADVFHRSYDSVADVALRHGIQIRRLGGTVDTEGLNPSAKARDGSNPSAGTNRE